MGRPFPLIAVLRLREQKEQAEERALLVISADLQQIRDALTRVEQEMKRFGDVRQQLTQGVIRAAQHQMLALQWRSLLEADAQLRSRLQSLETSRAAQQQCLLVARRNREMLSELSKQHHHRAEEEANRTERKRIDDFFSARSARAVLGADRSKYAKNA